MRAASLNSSTDGFRISMVTRATLRNAFEGRVVQHQPALAPVRKANGDDAAGLDLDDDAFFAPNRVLVGVERDLLQEVRERRLIGGLLVLACDADELLEILDSALRLDRPFGLERLQVAAPLEGAFDELRDGELERPRLERLHHRAELLHGTQRRRPDAGLLRELGRLPQ